MTVIVANATLTKCCAEGERGIHAQNVALFIADLLEDHSQWFAAGVSEYTLIARLQKAPYNLFDKEALRESLALFQTHFVIFHALYQLQLRWHAQGVGHLAIHTLKITLHETSEPSSAPIPSDPLRDYYLNWGNFDETGKDDVEALLDDFWQRMGGHISHDTLSTQEIAKARQVLELSADEPLTLGTIKRHYRRLIHQHHPDKGGDPAAAKQLVRAYSMLTDYVRASAQD
ncbi:DNA-J related domain-containing protein [Alteromonas halophila]|uniref:J domain-containing protein n=1 Tax=Alteromonas halophila TaxID=516698 RepID=A0A918JJL6_9ALTE|nr:DNA-J related domain-containing protein [Alteromonas halophila]GGW84455.1 hypothetical protein GCM10007391_17730 [Alteromonas halophila]